MKFSERFGSKEDRVEQDIENVLKDTNKDLSEFKDLVLTKNSLKLSNNNPVERISEKEITTDHIINILKSVKDQTSFTDIYKKNSAGITFAVQYALDTLGYTGTLGNIDGLYGNKTKAAVQVFQTKWNEDHTTDTITVDGAAGPETIRKLLEKLVDSSQNSNTNSYYDYDHDWTADKDTPDKDAPDKNNSNSNIYGEVMDGNLSHISQLTEITSSVATALAKKRQYLSLNGLTEITSSVATELAKTRRSLFLNGLTKITPPVATELAKTSGYLSLDGLTKITLPVATELAKTSGYLFLDGLDSKSLALYNQAKKKIKSKENSTSS